MLKGDDVLWWYFFVLVLLFCRQMPNFGYENNNQGP